MMIDVISPATILVALSGEDIKKYDLDFKTTDTEASRAGLTRLMLRVGEECGLSHSSKSYLIEALPGGDSVLLIITVRGEKLRKKYRIKKTELFECGFFSNADDLLDYLRICPPVGCTVFGENSGWWLVPDLPLSGELRGRLCEFGSLRELSPVALARIREQGRIVYERRQRRPRKPVFPKET